MRPIVVRLEVTCVALALGFILGMLSHRHLRLQPLVEPSVHSEPAGLLRLAAARAPPSAAPPPAPRPKRAGLLPGYTFAGVGNLPGDDAPCQGDGQRHVEEVPAAPRRQPGALGSMCQPGNVSAPQCARACDELETCLGFVWSPRPPWSKYSECYLKGSCPLGRLRALEGSFTWQKNSTQCASKRRPEWIEAYGVA